MQWNHCKKLESFVIRMVYGLPFIIIKSHINHCANFINAIRNGEPLAAEISVGHLSALYAHLGNISHWADERIFYDEKARKITNSEKANSMITPAYRSPWMFPAV